jgi:membrane-bound ClpP family serine protease
MLSVYWICLGLGVAFTFLALVFDGVMDGVLDGLDAFDGLDGFLDPLSIVGGVATFGGAGVLLTTYATLSPILTGVFAGIIGLVLSLVMHFAYVKPMKRAENSTGFSMKEYRGKLGEANTAIPATGYGEVLVRMAGSTTFQTAASFEGVEIPRGTPIVVVEVDTEGTLRVAPMHELQEAAN